MTFAPGGYPADFADQPAAPFLYSPGHGDIFGPMYGVLILAGCLLLVWVWRDIVAYVQFGWRQYALDETEWRKLQHHLQQLPRDKETY